MTRKLYSFRAVILFLALHSSCTDGFFLDSIIGQKNPRVATRKDELLQKLDDPTAFNSATKERTQLVTNMIQENPLVAPGSTQSFTPIANGKWRIIYAPHISVMGEIFRGKFDPVYYYMKPNGEMSSHARYSFPFVGSGWLSVSGTYGSEDEDRVCRVDFDKAWVKLLGDDKLEEGPYESLDDVPPSLWKTGIQALGQLFFIEAVSVFPVSYLDRDTIVFDFELLGTRICARKIGPMR